MSKPFDKLIETTTRVNPGSFVTRGGTTVSVRFTDSRTFILSLGRGLGVVLGKRCLEDLSELFAIAAAQLEDHA